MWLVVGLGNPGGEHARDRHNIGFRVVDALAARSSTAVVWRDKLGASVTEAEVAGARALLCKPMEFMNASGEATARVARFWKVPPSQTVVIHDDLDLPFGALRVASGGGHGGNNGVRSLLGHLDDAGFPRVRFGIGRPRPGQDAAAYVLAGFDRAEAAALDGLLSQAAEAVEHVVRTGVQAAMNAINGKARQSRQKQRERPATTDPTTEPTKKDKKTPEGME